MAGDDKIEVMHRADGRELKPWQLKIYSRAGLEPAEALRWADLGIEPYQAEGYRAAGLRLEEAHRCMNLGISGSEVAAIPLSVLRKHMADVAAELAPVEQEIIELGLRPSDVRRLLQQAMGPVEAVSWLRQGGPVSQASLWRKLGVSPAEAGLAARLELSPATCISWSRCGFSPRDAVRWRSHGFTPSRGAAWRARGFDPDEAADWAAAGVAPARAAKARERGDTVGAIARPARWEPDFNPDEPWSAEVLAAERRRGLEAILQSNFGVAAADGVRLGDLRAQILELQRNPQYRGTIRWAPNGTDEIVLYHPAAARWAKRVATFVDSLGTWDDLRKALRRRDESARLVAGYLWTRWTDGHVQEFGVENPDDERWDGVASTEELLDLLPSDAPCRIELTTDDGEATIVDPFDPWQMGVPPVIIDRYYTEQANMVSTWTSVPAERMASVRRTLRALGWRFVKGRLGDLPLYD